MAMSRWDPYEELLAMGERMDRILGLSGGSPGGRWLPAMDVYESGDEILVRLEVPGVWPGDLDLSLEDETLIIRGERQVEQLGRTTRRTRMERSYGPFERQLTLPRTARLDEVDARFEDGILEIRVPKQGQREPRRIDVHRAAEARAAGRDAGTARLGTPDPGTARPAAPQAHGGRAAWPSPDDGWAAVEDGVPAATVPDDDLAVPLAAGSAGEISAADAALAACIADGTYGSSIDTDDGEESCARPARPVAEGVSLEETIEDIRRSEEAERPRGGEDVPGASGQQAA